MSQIRITSVDNELILIASQAGTSSVLCHLKGGNRAPVDFEFDPADVLDPGAYTLHILGINWGGPASFQVEVSAGGPPQNFTYNGFDSCWSESTMIHV